MSEVRGVGGSGGTKYWLGYWLGEIKGRGPKRPQGHSVVYNWVGLDWEGEGRACARRFLARVLPSPSHTKEN